MRQLKPKPYYLNLGGRPFKVGEILDSKGNGYKTISYGKVKIIGIYKKTKIKTFVDKHPKYKAFLKKLGFKIKRYDYKVIDI